jgi:hypothetical protein
MVDVPALIPSTDPVVEPTVAMPVAVLLQLPPVMAFASTEFMPMQVLATPIIGPGAWFTVTTVFVVHPDPIA